ncbi:small ribosomal subunit protein bS6m-like [Oscarella lobularis]|uniref:small ribosomal subunit protein bS6m-like n=1 Tax=Oscarella lobularis TaxID=121494 RepID=UPI00331346A5
MVLYEMGLILRASSKEATAAILRRISLSVMDLGGLLTEIENLGQRELPYRMRSHTEYHTKGRYFFFYFHGSPSIVKRLDADCLKMDEDIVRATILKKD